MEGKVEIDVVLPHSPEKVWRALTNSEVLAKWMMPNDFEPRIGYRFQFQASKQGNRNKPTEPDGEPGGITGAHCEVIEMEAPHRLAYTWRESSDSPDSLPDLVTWILEPSESGTRLRMEHVAALPTFVSAVSNLRIDSALRHSLHIVGRLAVALGVRRPIMRGQAVCSVAGFLSAQPLLISRHFEEVTL
jgi:uncharacterized protein YndB with AHSA1/START domain